ncbi:hypothetical protein HOLleu_01533 [Holothuria leucospilota]|uniref:Uncharacterized protein n=1 Tax=Holothuria leucospilota TaxID=206669 RepID=A0A9Q1CQZ3_HOLLE|nr:hypothetical protein HOLleu_01533 [Holothuria leucospilota]
MTDRNRTSWHYLGLHIKCYIHRNHNAFLHSGCDGTLFKSHDLFCSEPTALQIQLYCDDFNVNPLGNKVRTYKIGAFYFTLGNLHPCYRSKLYVMQLLCLCRSEVVKKFGLSSEEIQNKFDSDDFELRTEEAHRHHVESVQLHPTLASTYGVTKDSPLNELEYFNVVSGFPPDLAHDLFEGVVPEILTLCLKQFVLDDVCTLDVINNAFLNFPYQCSDKCSKPSVMSSELSQFKVKQTASQTWCLLRLLPIMLGDVIPPGNQYFELILSLIAVVELICAPVQDGSTIALMKSKITDLLYLLRELFPDFTMKPKCHFLVHYSDLTMKYGPLSKCWTLRFKGKHSYFKQISRQTKNMKNICLT